MAKVAKTFRLDKETWTMLSVIAEDNNETMTGTLKKLIEHYDNNTDCSTKQNVSSLLLEDAISELFDTLKTQLEVKDKQIESLSKTLVNAQESLKVAETFRAVDALPPRSTSKPLGKKRKKTLLKRWIAFWL